MERLRKLLAEVETDDPDFDNEDNGPEDVLEEIFPYHESFCEHDTESEEDGDSGNEDLLHKPFCPNPLADWNQGVASLPQVEDFNGGSYTRGQWSVE
ncbi:hypothetical protein AVEN_239087-1 [Araneus ventricosus]|uniref:Uncharacterized protein n=1 Tax=Araneus ventricosus TaxID=182803 RepID=A0A4Y2FPG5_ARAVE|nr:hypothetical protein AVEN_239087-1 [Araneus ventricosus]